MTFRNPLNVRFLDSRHLANPVLALYDGEDGAPVGVVTPIDPTPPAPGTGGLGMVGDDPNALVDVNPEARFDQDAVNKIVQDRLAKDRKKHDDKYKGLEKSYQDVLATKALSDEDRTQLEQSLEDLRKQHRSKEEQAKHEKNQLTEKYESELVGYKEAAITWENKYKQFLIEKSLMDAAHANDAFLPAQILSVVREWTKLVDAVDENGVKTGELTPMVDLPDVDADTQKAIITQRTPMDAIDRLKELQPNLFKSNVVSGVGGNSTTGGIQPGADGRIDQKELTTDQWFKLYKDDPSKLGLRDRKQR